MKKNDIILISALLILGIVSFCIIKYAGKDNNAWVEVVIDGETYKTFDLDEDITYKIIIDEEDFNLLLIKNGKVSITKASCPDKLCVNQKEISKSGESIICLPNKVVVRIVNSEDTSVDAVAD